MRKRIGDGDLRERSDIYRPQDPVSRTPALIFEHVNNTDFKQLYQVMVMMMVMMIVMTMVMMII